MSQKQLSNTELNEMLKDFQGRPQTMPFNEEFYRLFTESTENNSETIRHTRNTTATAGKVSTIKFESRENVDIETIEGSFTETVNESLVQISMPHKPKRITVTVKKKLFRRNGFDLMDYVAQEAGMVLGPILDEYVINDSENSILRNESGRHMFDDISQGVQFVSGYIPTKRVTVTSVKNMLDHLPRGHKANARWFMHKSTARSLYFLEDTNGNWLLGQDQWNEDRTPNTLLEKPIIVVRNMPKAIAGNVPIVLADLSKGYMFGTYGNGEIHISNSWDHEELIFHIEFDISGQMLQPSAFKGLKIV